MYKLLLISGVLSAVLAINSFLIYVNEHEYPHWRVRAAKISGPILALAAVAALVAIWRFGYRPIDQVEVGLRIEGDRYEEFLKSRMCWRRDCVIVANSTEVEGTVRPITDNPKVRQLKYSFEVVLVDSATFARAVQLKPNASCPAEGPSRCQLKDAVLYEVYEFNNANSKELARFYNPYDLKQSVELQDFMRQKLGPRLAAKGIGFKRLIAWNVE